MHRRWAEVTLALVFAVCLVQAASAADVAYILEDSSTPSNNIKDSITGVGLTYNIIRDSQIPTANFSQYSIILVGEEVGNQHLLPLSTKSSVFFDESTAELVWSGASGVVSSNARELKVVYVTHPVFEGVTVPIDGVISIYSGTGREMHYLRIKPSYVTSLAIKTSENQAGIAFTESMISGGKRVRKVFFGATDQNAWTSNGNKILRNILLWEMEEVDQDQDSYVLAVDCNDNNPLIHPGATEVPYDSVDQDCSGNDLLDVDGDQFCASGALIQNAAAQCLLDAGKLTGSDCNDNDDTINRNNPDNALNCVNDAPEIINIPQNLVFNEDETIEFEVIALDPEDDALIYSINDTRFDIVDNTFSLEPSYDNDGTHTFEITVSDGEYSDSGSITIVVWDINQPPVSHAIFGQSWFEDGNHVIDLNDYFEDGSALTFGIGDSSGLDKIHVDVNEFGIANFTSETDFTGTEYVSFYADDGLSRTESNLVTLTVTPVNDALRFEGEIENLTWGEDTVLDEGLDLNDYFFDVDSVLEFEVIGNVNIDIQIEDGLVFFAPAKNFAGTEEVYFNATDGEFSVMSNKVTLTVVEEGETPVFSDLNCTTHIDEDVEYTCVVEATDLENNTLTFSSSSSEDLVCEFEGNVLTYKSELNYNGAASCALVVTDIHGSDTKTLNVNITAVNDAPEIVSASPETSTISVIEGKTKAFSVEVRDVDSELSKTWFLNGVIVGNNASSYTFPISSAGMYILEFKARDVEHSVSKTWNVLVGPISDFTCAEAGGDVCTGDETCGSGLLGVKDSNVCCANTCIPAFKDADACEVVDPRVRIEFIEEDDEIKLGDKQSLEFKVYNDGTEEQSFDINAYLYDLDKDKSVFDTDGEGEIRGGSSRTFRFDMEIPEDLDLEREYAFFITADDEMCGQNYELIQIERPEEKIIISDFNLPSDAVCGETVEARIKTENLGTSYKDVKLTAVSRELGLEEEASFRLTKFDSDEDKETSNFEFVVPEVESGAYKVKATIQYGTNKRTSVEEEIQITCIEETVSGAEIGAEVITNQRVLLNTLSGKSENATARTNYASILMILAFNILLAGMVIVLHEVNHRRKVSGGKKL